MILEIKIVVYMSQSDVAGQKKIVAMLKIAYVGVMIKVYPVIA